MQTNQKTQNKNKKKLKNKTMKTTVNNLESAEKEIVVTLTPQDMKPYLKTTAQELAKDAAIKGFRKGKVPYNILEQHIGKEALWNQASVGAIEESYQKALQEQGIKPAGQPRVDITKLVPENDVEFKVRIPLEPTVTLPDYKKIAKDALQEQTATAVEVSDHEIHEALEYLRESRKDDKQKAPVQIDDSFAQSVGNFKNVEELKDSVKQGITQEKEQHNKELVRLKIIENIRKDATLVFSELLVENELRSMEQELQERVAGLGMEFEEYLKKMGKSLEELRGSWQEKARARVESAFILSEIARVEGIQPTEQEVEEHSNQYLRHFGGPDQAQETVEPAMLKRYIFGMLQNEKVLEFLEGQKSSIITP